MKNETSNLGKKRAKEEEVSPGEQSARKSARREEESAQLPLPSPSPSSEVEELRHKLRQSEEMYQKACREALEAKERAERAENQLLDSQPSVADWDGLEKELENRLIYVTAQLDEARINAENSDASKNQALRENDSLTIHLSRFKSREEAAIRVNTNLEARNTALEMELETARISAEAATLREINLTEEVNVLKQKLEALKSSEDFANRMKDHFSRANADLMKQLVIAAARVPEIPPNIRETMSGKIEALEKELNETKTKLAISNGRNEYTISHFSRANADLMKQLEVAAARIPEIPPNIRETMSGKIEALEKELNETKSKLTVANGPNELVLLNTKGDDFNIFQLCLPNPGNTISLEDAQRKMRPKYEEFEKRNDFSSIWSQVNIGHRLMLDCEACRVNVQKTGILSHFLSSKHALKARSYGAAVSLAAVLQWERVLDNRPRRTSHARIEDDNRRRRSSEGQAKADSKPI